MVTFLPEIGIDVDSKTPDNKNDQPQSGNIGGTAKDEVEELNNQLSRLESDLDDFSEAILRLAKSGVFSIRPRSPTSPFPEVRDRRDKMSSITGSFASSLTAEEEQPNLQPRSSIQLWPAFVLLAVTAMVLIQWLTRSRKVSLGSTLNIERWIRCQSWVSVFVWSQRTENRGMHRYN